MMSFFIIVVNICQKIWREGKWSEREDRGKHVERDEERSRFGKHIERGVKEEKMEENSEEN